MHLGANSIRHLMKTLKSTDAYTLTEFYDEGLSHYLWHSGVIALSALLIWRQWRNPFADSAPIVSVAFSALVYGLTYFITTIEAGTAPVGVPFAVGAALFGLLKRKELGTKPLAAFFVAAYVIATILIVVWAALNGGRLPQSSEVGIIE